MRPQPAAHASYGVVITPIDPEIDEYEIDRTATDALRAEIRAARQQWLNVDPAEVAARFRDGELDTSRPVAPLRRRGRLGHLVNCSRTPPSNSETCCRVRAAPHWDMTTRPVGPGYGTIAVPGALASLAHRPLAVDLLGARAIHFPVGLAMPPAVPRRSRGR